MHEHAVTSHDLQVPAPRFSCDTVDTGAEMHLAKCYCQTTLKEKFIFTLRLGYYDIRHAINIILICISYTILCEIYACNTALVSCIIIIIFLNL